METNVTEKYIEEKILKPANGILMLVVAFIAGLGSIVCMIMGCASQTIGTIVGMWIGALVLATVSTLLFVGLHQVNPNEAMILVLFGKYYGTVKEPGFYYTNAFARPMVPVSDATAIKEAAKEAAAESAKGKNKGSSGSIRIPRKRVSLKTSTLNNEKQKVNDVLGNPVIIGSIVIWKVKDPTNAVFSVEDYTTFLSTQCDTVVRNVARMYPYDNMEDDSEEKTLRGSSQEIAAIMQVELQKRVENAGLEILDVRITNLSYAEEIAAAMLQRQQATAIIAARQKLVEGAVGMVKMALDKLDDEDVVALDDERKAAMVSNLLVVLCGNKDTQPIVNSGNIY